MNQQIHKRRVWIVTVVGIALLLLLVGLRLAVNPLLRWVAQDKWGEIEKRYDLQITCDDLRYAGNGTIRIDGLSVVPLHADTLLHADRIAVQLNLRQLLQLHLSVRHIESDRLAIHFVKDSTRCNYAFLFRDHSAQHPTHDNASRSYADRCERIFDMMYRLLPSRAAMRDLIVTYHNQGDAIELSIPRFIINDSRFKTVIRSKENGQVSLWTCSGRMDEKLRMIEAVLSTDNTTRLSLPFINYRWNADMQFDTLSFRLHDSRADHIERITGDASVSGLTLHHERISPDTVLLDRGRFRFDLSVGKDYIQLDSTSEVHFNALTFHPFTHLTKSDTAWHVIASINKRNFPAQELFASLPRGLFGNLDGIQTEGTLDYHLFADIDFARLDSLVFESSLRSKGFRIVKMGRSDLARMSEPFEYTAYEAGEPVKTFVIGPANPSFRSYDQISRYLPLCIMQNEDAGFFHHAGFIPSAIRDALVVDLQRRKFARGGSTISMQLVKNVFLSKNKTMARKMEEILITWLIETCRLTPKERMFEVYLNIAEWGPHIYGVTDAAQFYFRKQPSQLSLGECIFLTSIIPKPKHFRSSFDGLQLKPWYEEFFRVILNRLVIRELVPAEETAGVTPQTVVVTGDARQLLLGDSVSIDEPPLELLPSPDWTSPF